MSLHELVDGAAQVVDGAFVAHFDGIDHAVADIERDFRTTQRSCARVTRETIRNEKWTTKLAGFVLKTIAPLL